MRKAISLTLMAFMASALPACNSNMNDYAKQASKDLGIPVEAMGPKDDPCAEAQFQAFSDEYQQMASGGQTALKTALRAKYKKILVEGTKQIQAVTGSRTSLSQWREYVCAPDRTC